MADEKDGAGAPASLAQSGPVAVNRAELHAEGGIWGNKIKVLGSFTPKGVWAGAGVIGVVLIGMATQLRPAENASHGTVFWIATFILGVTCGMGFAAGEIQRLADEVIARRSEIEKMAARKAELEKELLHQGRLSSAKKKQS